MQINRKGRSSPSGPAISRRRFLAWISGLAAASACSSPGMGKTAGARLIGRWQTGNRNLVPFTCKNGLVYVAGDNSVEVWKPGQDQPLWQRKLARPSAFRPRLGNTILLVSGRTHMSAWQRGTGAHLWSREPAGDRQFAVPLIHDGRIYFGQGPKIISLDAATGKRLWDFATTPETSSAYAPTACRDMILFGPGDGILYAFEAVSGRLLWQLDREKDWQYLRQLHMSGDILIAGGYKEHLYGLGVKDGRQLWRFYAGNFINSHLVSDGMVFFWSPTGWIYALDAASGKRLWRHRTTDYKKASRKKNWAPVMAELVADHKYLYVLAMDRVLHVLDKNTGLKARTCRLGVAVRPFVCLTAEPGKVLLGSMHRARFYILI